MAFKCAAVLLAAAMVLAGCGPKSVEVETDPAKTTYSRDVRTGVCFATLGREFRGNYSFSMGPVECTPEVLDLVPVSQRGPVGRARSARSD